jgi:hypothetical protein
MFGPNVIVTGGNHNTSLLGRFMYDVQEKRPEDDQDVIIEDDVGGFKCCNPERGESWKRIHCGAGAVVNRDVLPYTVVGAFQQKLLSALTICKCSWSMNRPHPLKTVE